MAISPLKSILEVIVQIVQVDEKVSEFSSYRLHHEIYQQCIAYIVLIIIFKII